MRPEGIDTSLAEWLSEETKKQNEEARREQICLRRERRRKEMEMKKRRSFLLKSFLTVAVCVGWMVYILTPHMNQEIKGQTVQVKWESVNIRTKPGNGDVVRKAERYECLELTGKEAGTFVEVKSESGKTYWVASYATDLKQPY